MIPKECKRLAEVDFPIAAVSKQAVREKGLPQGHPSRMHLWWARRPLASSRAILLSVLLPDPCDTWCPKEFKREARALLPQIQGNIGPRDEDLRAALLKFIADFTDWDLGTNSTFIEVSRSLIRAAHGSDEPPLVVDPFAGGGSIPLEALRLGCDTFASDLNPVACLILKVLLEDIPRRGPEIADELRRVGAAIKQEVEKDLIDLYPKDPDGASPIAYIWARTAFCEAPNCGAEIPLLRSFWLCKKPTRRKYLRYSIERPKDNPPRVEFEIFQPETEKDVPAGTVTRSKATCLCCGVVLPPERVRAQLMTQRGGADVIFDLRGQRVGGARMLAVVTLRPGETGRHYRLPTELDYESVWRSQQRVESMLQEWQHGRRDDPCPVPNEPLPPIGTLGFRVQRYGMLQWGDLFSARQKIALVTIASAVTRSGCPAISLALGKLADLATSGCLWHTKNECPNQVLTTGRIKPFWDFAEGVPTSASSGGWQVCVDKLVGGILSACVGTVVGDVAIAPAQSSPLGSESAAVWFTDPPYYDAIAYADLSDFFFVWLKRALPGHPLLLDPFDPANALTPKRLEAVQDETREFDGYRKDRAAFEEMMAKCFREGRRVLNDDGVGCVVFAHKTTEGWEALLSGIIRTGWVITGSWPIATEMTTRLRARESAALATSIHLVCRPRSGDASIGDWAEVLRELPGRVGDWIERLQGEGVRGADLVFACIGPALEVFSRHSKVETAEGREVTLAEYLEKVWEVVGRSALNQILGTAEASARNGVAGALEEDARLTALFLWTLQSTSGEATEDPRDEGEDEEEADDEDDAATSRSRSKGFTLVFDVVRRFAQPLGIDLPKWERRVIEIKKGVVRLLPIAERAKQLFGEDGAQAVAARLESAAMLGPNPLQGMLFPEMEAAPTVRRRGARDNGRRTGSQISDASLTTAREATTLDRVHAAMLLQAGGRTNALRALLNAEQERSPDFLRLANALSALYPMGSEEKRLLDAMLLAVPR
jgi:putative DNA methylase